MNKIQQLERMNLTEEELKKEVIYALCGRFPANQGIFKKSLINRVVKIALKEGSVSRAINAE